MKKLRKYNGNLGGTQHGIIAAYSSADAVHLLNACGYNVSANYFKTFWTCGLWGNQAESQIGSEPSFRGLWVKPCSDFKAPYVLAPQVKSSASPA